MDSLSQLVLGSALAATAAPARHRRAALLAGAALGTLPDLDGFVISAITSNPVHLMTWHRGASHSLFLLPLLAWLIWWSFRQRNGRVAQAPRAWFWAIFLPLFTHPILDAFTSYGTQLFWPLPVHPAMWSSVFIIDPAYTLWLLLAVIAAWWLRERRLAQQLLMAGLIISSTYLAWSLAAKAMVDRAAQAALAPLGLAEAPRFSVAAPFTSLLYRVVVMTPDGYLIGDRAVLADQGPMRFSAHRSDTAALQAASHIPAVQELSWFNRGYMRAQVRDDGLLVLSDLRMGIDPNYSFNFGVARQAGQQWQALDMPMRVRASGPGALSRANLGMLWHGTWERALRGTQG